LLQKVCTNHISAKWAFVWPTVGCLVLQPWLYPGKVLLAYSVRSLGGAFPGGVFNGFGARACLAAMKSGGKASIAALYQIVVVLLASFVLHETITIQQTTGILCSLNAVVLLST